MRTTDGTSRLFDLSENQRCEQLTLWRRWGLGRLFVSPFLGNIYDHHNYDSCLFFQCHSGSLLPLGRSEDNGRNHPWVPRRPQSHLWHAVRTTDGTSRAFVFSENQRCEQLRLWRRWGLGRLIVSPFPKNRYPRHWPLWLPFMPLPQCQAGLGPTFGTQCGERTKTLGLLSFLKVKRFEQLRLWRIKGLWEAFLCLAFPGKR